MTPISTPPLDTLAGVPLPAGKPPAPPEAAAVNWFLTWLGQMGEVPEEALPEEAETKKPPTAATPAEPPQQQVQWLTLIPSVPAFQQPVPEEKGKEKEKQTASAAPLPAPSPAEPEKLEKPEKLEVEPEPEAPKVAAELPVALPLPTAVESPKPPTPAPTPEAPTAQLESRPQTPLPQAPPTPAAPPLQPVQNPDKGEVIWSAQLLVTAPAAKRETPAAPPANAAPAPLPETAKTNTNSNTDTGRQSSGRQDKPTPGHASEPQLAVRQQPVNQAAPARAEESTQPETPEPRSAPTEKVPAPARREPRPAEPAAEKAPEPKPLEASPRTSFPAEFHAGTAAPRESASATTTGVTATSSVDVDPPKPLRAAQIATLQVDVPAAAGDDNAAPMRLIVSQRGEQVNVRLRSWDPGTPPLEASRMQPLLHSLNEKGFSPAAELSEPNPAYLDRPHEKTLATAESPNTGNDQQNFLGADDRQQQNQERQQQQQAFFLRKQMRNLQSGNFDPGLVLGGNPLSQQGAVR